MPTLGVSIAIIHSGQVLLIEREDFRAWCLPGGEVDAGESVAQAAMREVREETELEVQLTRLVGIYSRPRWRTGDHEILFSAVPVSGASRPVEREALRVRYFDPDALPDRIIAWHRRQILDALDGVGGSVAWSLNPVWPFEQRDMTRRALYGLLDSDESARERFYSQLRRRLESDDEQLEVGGRSTMEDERD